jgi:hypothetical protein
MTQVFRPLQSVRMDCSITSKRVVLPADTINFRVYNSSSSVAWVVTGDSSVTAVIPALDTAGPGFPVAPFTVENFTEAREGGGTHIATILASGTGVVHVTCGEGW